MAKNLKTRINLATFTLRSGLAIAFLYAAISSILQPDVWTTFLPAFIPSLTLFLFSLFQVGLAIWLLSPYKTYEAAIVSSITLFFITIANISALDFVFRDVAIFLASVSLTILTKDGK